MDALQLQGLLSKFEADIQAGKRKGIFDRESHINLSYARAPAGRSASEPT